MNEHSREAVQDEKLACLADDDKPEPPEKPDEVKPPFEHSEMKTEENGQVYFELEEENPDTEDLKKASKEIAEALV